MKKKLLALAMAVVMIISLLPVTAFAGELPVRARFDINDPNLTKELSTYIDAGKTYYVKFVDVEGTNGNMPVLLDQDADVPTDNYMKFQFVDGVCQVTFNKIDYRPTAKHSAAFLEFTTQTSNYSNVWPVVVTLEGENNISGDYAYGIRIIFSNDAATTITGNGSLNINMSYPSETKLNLIQQSKKHNLTIRDAELNLTCTDSGKGLRMISSVGNIIIDHSKVIMNGNYGSAFYSGSSSSASTDTNIGVTIQNGSDVTINYSQNVTPITTAGSIVIDNSTTYIAKKLTFAAKVMPRTPIVINCASAQYCGTNQVWTDYDMEGGSTCTFTGFQTVMNGYTEPEEPEECEHVFDKDCTTADTCANCEAVAEKADAHVFDKDCTTADTCANCEAVAAHDFSVIKKIVKPTDKARGYTRYKCANCDETEVRDVVPALTSAVAKFEGEYYNTLAEALEAAKASTSEEKLIEMVRKETGAALVIDTNVTIDFGGLAYTVNTANKNGAAFIIAADVILKNGTIQPRYAERTLFNYLIVNNGDLTTKDIILRGEILGAAGESATIMNNGTLDLQSGTVVRVKKIGLVATADVTKDASVELEVPEGYCWAGNTTLANHNFEYETKIVEATVYAGGYTKHICECGESYIDNRIWRLEAYAENVTTGALYQTLAEAVADAKEGETVKLLKNQTGAALVINANNVTVNFGERTYTVDDDVETGAAVVVAEGVVATLTNGMVQIRYTARKDFNCLVENNGTLNVDSTLTLKATNAYAEGAVAVKGEVTGNAVIVNPKEK